MTKKYFITEEWNEGDQLACGRRRSRVVAYGLMSTKDIKNVEYYMDRFSPYDYIDTMTYDTKEEYEKMLTTLEENGSEINRDESQQTLT